MWSSSSVPETVASSESKHSRPVIIASEQTPFLAQSTQPVIISSIDEPRTVEVPVACPVIDLAAGDSSLGVVDSSSFEDEADAEVAEARHEAAQARVRLLEARVRERTRVARVKVKRRYVAPRKRPGPQLRTSLCSRWLSLRRALRGAAAGRFRA